MKKSKTSIKSIAFCGILSALGVVIMYIGSLFESLDLTFAMIASLLLVFTVIECKGFMPWLTYAVISLVSILLLGNKLPAVAFIVSGYYPIVKQYFEKIKNRAISWVLKIVVFNLALTVLVFLFKLILPSIDLLGVSFIGGNLRYVAVYLLGNLIFVLYDLLLTRIIIIYLYRLRKKLGIFKN